MPKPNDDGTGDYFGESTMVHTDESLRVKRDLKALMADPNVRDYFEPFSAPIWAAGHLGENPVRQLVHAVALDVVPDPSRDPFEVVISRGFADVMDSMGLDRSYMRVAEQLPLGEPRRPYVFGFDQGIRDATVVAMFREGEGLLSVMRSRMPPPAGFWASGHGRRYRLDPLSRRAAIRRFVTLRSGAHTYKPERAYAELIRQGWCRIERRRFRAPRVVWL